MAVTKRICLIGRQETGWHRDEIAPANVTEVIFGGALLFALTKISK
jgi:hypothetical protein